MEMFFTPEDVENEYGIQTKTLANWRANLIGPECIRWMGKILYHSEEIEDWFEAQKHDADQDTEPEEESKPESEPKPSPEADKESDTNSEPESQTEAKTDMGTFVLLSIGES